MTRYRVGDIVQDDAEALVNSVNCVGVMGKGIALAFKKAFPANYAAYARACRASEVSPGSMFVFLTGALTPRYIINFPTKRHWRANSRLDDIRRGLDALVAEVADRGIRSIAIPALGSGHGGLEWSRVRPLIADAAARMVGVDVVVYEPSDVAPARRGPVAPPRMTTSRALLVAAIERYSAVMLDSAATSLVVHKLMYLLQEAGQPLQLRYERGWYGPFAANLTHLLASINHHYIEMSCEDPNSPSAVIDLLPGSTIDAHSVLANSDSAACSLERVYQLIDGWESPHGLELLSTVHWLLVRERAKPAELVDRVHEWSTHKRNAFSAGQIRSAERTLSDAGWLTVPPN